MDKKHREEVSPSQKKSIASIAIRIVLILICVFILYGEYTRQKAEEIAQENEKEKPVIMNEYQTRYQDEINTYKIKDGKLYGSGDNTCGQLGTGEIASQDSYVQRVLIAENVIHVSACYGTMVYLNDKNELYGVGDNGSGQLGESVEEQDGRPYIAYVPYNGYKRCCVTEPVFIMDHVKYAVVGGGYIMVLQEDGTLFALGDNLNGQLGNGTARPVRNEWYAKEGTVYSSEPVHVLDDIAFIAADYNTAAAISKKGDLWIWGDNSFGEIGNSRRGNGQPSVSTDVVSEPYLALKKIKEVYFEDYTVYAVDFQDQKYSWGKNAAATPMLVEENKPKYPVYLVESIDNLHLDSEEFNIENYYIRNECQYSNHYYIDSDNVLWGYGGNAYGQLGNGKQYRWDVDGEYWFEMTPQKIAENVIHVDYGGYFVIFLTENGDLYGIGANLNGVMGMELSEYYTGTPEVTVVTEPVCLMQDVAYARAGMRGIVALKNDGSVWWWGEIITTSAKNIKDTEGVSYTKPEKMLEDAIYVTCGNFSIAAIKEDGTLWTWGNNTFGSCGYDSNDKDFIEEPVMVLEDVKMVWMDEARFDTVEERLGDYISPYTCDYTYVTFAEKKDGTLYACGYEVEGKGSKSFTYMLYGDILRTPDQMNGGEFEPVMVDYSDIFQRIEFREKDRKPQLQFRELEFGMAPEEVTEFLDGLDIDYKIIDGISDEKKVYDIVTQDQYFRFCFDDKHKLTAIHYSAYGTRNGKITIGMTRDEVEAVLGKSCSDEINEENNRYITALYQYDNIYEVGYSDGIVYYIEESMIENTP